MTEPGHNNPPPLTPLEAAREQISLLDAEAAHWFDGTEIATQAEADGVAKLIDAARKARSSADAARKVEKAPHDQAAKAVDAAWKPVIADADRIAEIGKAAQTVWLIKLDKAKREREEAARAEAEAKAAEARRLAQEADGSLAAAKARDAAIEEARRAETAALRAANDKAGAKGEGMARTVSLRTSYRATVADRRALLNHIAVRDPDALTAFVEDWAAKAVRSGAREIPGVTIHEERAAA